MSGSIFVQRIDDLIVDILVPARTEKKIYKPAFEKFEIILDEIESYYKDQKTIDKSVISVLFFIFNSLSAEAQYCNPKDELFLKTIYLEDKLEIIFGER